MENQLFENRLEQGQAEIKENFKQSHGQALKLKILRVLHLDNQDKIKIIYQTLRRCSSEKEIKRLSELEVIKEVENQDPGYISLIFFGDKKNNKHSLILNLKRFNKYVTYKYFKMNTLSHA